MATQLKVSLQPSVDLISQIHHQIAASLDTHAHQRPRLEGRWTCQLDLAGDGWASSRQRGGRSHC